MVCTSFMLTCGERASNPAQPTIIIATNPLWITNFNVQADTTKDGVEVDLS